MLVFTRTLSLALATIVILAIFYNVISTHFLGDPNNTLFSSDPFNFQNRVNTLSLAVQKSGLAPDELESMQEIANEGAILEPINARILALVGAVKQKTDGDAAQTYYVRALEIKPTESIALTQRYIFLIENNEFEQAIPLIEMISVRWPKVFRQLQPTIPFLLQTQENIDEILKRFIERPANLGMIISSIIKDNQIDLAYKLVLEAHRQYSLDVRGISVSLVKVLFDQGNYSQAYLLFYRTLFEEEKKNLGYVFNSSFQAKPVVSAFDWSIQQQAGVNIQRIQSRVLSSDGGEKSKLGGLEIKFLNAPVAFSNVSQMLYLPKKTYELSVNYSVDGLRGPTPISVKLTCNNLKSILAEIELAKMDTREETKTVTFKVPESGCDLQRILVTNNNSVESWRNRFNGKVIFHDISIKVHGS